MTEARKRPLAIDLYCGLGGWTEGLIAEGWDVIGFDIEKHEYGEEKYPGTLVIQDVLTLHGSQFKDVDLIVGSSPCQEFSYRAMPWKRAKALGPPELGMKLFEAQFRIQREASEAAGRHIPMIVENVRGALGLEKPAAQGQCSQDRQNPRRPQLTYRKSLHAPSQILGKPFLPRHHSLAQRGFSGSVIAMGFACLNCEDERWVCEEHPHKAWDPDAPDRCCGGAGMPCGLCNAGSIPDMPPGTELICSLIGEFDS